MRDQGIKMPGVFHFFLCLPYDGNKNSTGLYSMDRVRNLIQCDRVHKLGYTGRGVGVAILDTGACVIRLS